jgi:ankyrin repeat protein
MQLLIEKGADVNAKNSAGETALMFAATNGAPERSATPARQGRGRHR